MAKKIKPQDRRELIASGYDAQKLAQYERDMAAGEITEVVRELLEQAAAKCSIEQIKERADSYVSRARSRGTAREVAFSKKISAFLMEIHDRRKQEHR